MASINQAGAALGEGTIVPYVAVQTLDHFGFPGIPVNPPPGPIIVPPPLPTPDPCPDPCPEPKVQSLTTEAQGAVHTTLAPEAVAAPEAATAVAAPLASPEGTELPALLPDAVIQQGIAGTQAGIGATLGMEVTSWSAMDAAVGVLGEVGVASLTG